MKQRFREIWQSLKIEQKIKCFTSVVLGVILLSIFLILWIAKYSLFDFSSILSGNSLASDFVQCIEAEADLFEAYVKNGNENVYMQLEQAIADTQKIVTQLPYDYEKIGEVRYAKTWSILNMYQVYCGKRDDILNAEEKTTQYITALYEVYDIQNYLKNYANQLMRDTLEDGVNVYSDKVKMTIIVPVLLIFLEIAFFLCIQKLSELMNSSIVSPVMELA